MFHSNLGAESPGAGEVTSSPIDKSTAPTIPDATPENFVSMIRSFPLRGLLSSAAPRGIARRVLEIKPAAVGCAPAPLLSAGVRVSLRRLSYER